MRFISALPEPVKQPLRLVRNSIAGALYRGADRYCPVCEKSFRKFGKYSKISGEDTKCLYCGALQRHRLVWPYFKTKTDLFNGRPKKMLHIAPEPIFEKLLKKSLGESYLTADLHNPRAMLKIDITDIAYPDESFDVIFCSHVLEHVQNDRQAMREFHRILKPDGWAILLVPITADKTFEDPSVTNPADRLKLFGQDDHVRRYGPDFVERLKESGFIVEVIAPSDFLSIEKINIMGITDAAGDIYHCTK